MFQHIKAFHGYYVLLQYETIFWSLSYPQKNIQIHSPSSN